MTNLLNISPEAERDIFAITSNIRIQDSIASARHAVSEIKKQLHTLAEHPDTGRAGGCDGTKEAVMKGLPFIAVYQQSDTAVTIVRVLYGADERRQSKRS